EIFSDFGEMLFTHFGVSGPLILSASSFYTKKVFGQKAELSIDLKPALTEEQLDKRILRDFEENRNKQFKNALGGLLPVRLIPIIISLSGISPDKKTGEITKEERKEFIGLLKKMPLTVTGCRGFAEAVITQGGISINKVNPSTMESKLVQGLFFAGEVLDLDALTGGFNLQIAWSTGYLAGSSAERTE
ncbi:MAG TPA: aminoacetone oxidase family FAD-binding enzyme, partial [Lachnospiraceae bacterium]|nr:aminoacetone oxidase family FAD-binding enzyme [Lachnospiraceae bacterium]